MPLLGGLMVSLFGGLASFLASVIGMRAAVLLAGITASLGMLATLTAAITAALAGLVAAMPTESGFLTGLYFAVPDNGPAVIAFVLMVDGSLAVYRLGMDKVRMAVAS